MRCPKGLDEASQVAIGKTIFNPGIICIIPGLNIGFPRQVWRSKTGPLETQVIFVTIIRSSIRLSEKYNCKHHFSFHQLWPSLKNMFSQILRGVYFRWFSEIFRDSEVFIDSQRSSEIIRDVTFLDVVFSFCYGPSRLHLLLHVSSCVRAQIWGVGWLVLQTMF